MKDDKKDSGQELIDIDEKGNPIEKEKKEKIRKTNIKYKICLSIILIIIIISSCYCYFNYKNKAKSVFDKTTLKNLKLKNRIFLGPSIHNAEKIENIVKNDISLVITEGCIVGDYADTNLQSQGPFRIDNDKYIPEIKKLADIAHKHNSYILLDLVHLGIVSSALYSPSGGNFLIQLNQKL